jgi:hypothetical protein
MSKNWWEKSSQKSSHNDISTNNTNTKSVSSSHHRWKKFWTYFKKNWLIMSILFLSILSIIIFGIGFAISNSQIKYPSLGNNIPNDNYITNLSFGTSFKSDNSTNKLYCKEGDTLLPPIYNNNNKSFSNNSLNDNFKNCIDNNQPLPYTQLCYNNPSEINDKSYIVTDIKIQNWADKDKSGKWIWTSREKRCRTDNGSSDETWLPISTNSLTDILSPDIMGEICTPSNPPYQKICKGDKCCDPQSKRGICMKMDKYSTIKSGKVKGLKTSDLIINVTDIDSDPCPPGYTSVGNIHEGCSNRLYDVNICKK